MIYHEPTVVWLFMIGHSLGRMETCFGPSTQGAETKTHLKSRFCAILKKRGFMYEFEIDCQHQHQAHRLSQFSLLLRKKLTYNVMIVALNFAITLD